MNVLTETRHGTMVKQQRNATTFSFLWKIPNPWTYCHESSLGISTGQQRKIEILIWLMQILNMKHIVAARVVIGHPLAQRNSKAVTLSLRTCSVSTIWFHGCA